MKEEFLRLLIAMQNFEALQVNQAQFLAALEKDKILDDVNGEYITKNSHITKLVNTFNTTK